MPKRALTIDVPPVADKFAAVKPFTYTAFDEHAALDTALVVLCAGPRFPRAVCAEAIVDAAAAGVCRSSFNVIWRGARLCINSEDDDLKHVKGLPKRGVMQTVTCVTQTQPSNEYCFTRDDVPLPSEEIALYQGLSHVFVMRAFQQGHGGMLTVLERANRPGNNPHNAVLLFVSGETMCDAARIANGMLVSFNKYDQPTPAPMPHIETLRVMCALPDHNDMAHRLSPVRGLRVDETFANFGNVELV